MAKKKRQTKRQLAAEAGLSLHRMRQAIRVANVPDDEFERLVESDDPPTAEALANLGRRRGKKRRQAVPDAPCPHCGGTGRVAVIDVEAGDDE